MEALGGKADAREVKAWVNDRYPGGWADITVQMADLTFPGNTHPPRIQQRRESWSE